MPAKYAGEGKHGMRVRGSVARRAMLGAWFVLLAGAAGWAGTVDRAAASGETRTLSMFNIHTKANITVTYKRDGKFDEGALKKLNHFMRDWRKDKEIAMDPELIDLIWTLHHQLGSKEPVHLICGYRTNETNKMLRKTRGGQGKKSQHINGKAADITFPDISVKQLRNSALVQEQGGVGYYPTSGIPFVHVDTGNVRMWPRIPRLELAALFPDGNTKYLPSDGKPITIKDYKTALAQGKVTQTQIASASPVPLPDHKPGSGIATGMPQPILASYTPEAPGQPIIETSSAEEKGTPSNKLFTYASAGGTSLRPNLFSKTEEASLPREEPAKLYEDAEVVTAPEVDDDHPEELSYVPFEIAGLMTDASVAYSATVAPLTHPEQENLDYLFSDMDRPTAFTFRKSSGYQGLASAQRFSGEAIKSLYAEMEKPAPTQLAQSTH
jgi:uncharacterized protein YcbK (DUF882 family)